MSGGRNFEKLRGARNIALRGHEPREGMNLIPGKVRRGKSKAQLRAEAQDLITSDTLITKIIECRCGHRGRVRIPLARAAGSFKCVVCEVST